MKLLSSDELVSYEFPDEEFLVDPIIPQGGNVLVYGEPEVGKSMFLNTLVATMANELPLFGRWPTKKGSSVVMQADMGGQIQQRRLIKSLEEISLEEVFWLMNEDGSTPIVDITKLRLVQKALIEKIQEEIDPMAIHWDSLRRVHTLPENASETASQVINAAKQISPGSTDFFYHHTRKKSTDPDALEHDEENFMGSQHWRSHMDTMFFLQKIDRGAAPERVKCTITKARTAPPWEKNEPIILEADPRTMLLLPVDAYNRERAKDAVAELRASRDEALRLQG